MADKNEIEIVDKSIKEEIADFVCMDPETVIRDVVKNTIIPGTTDLAANIFHSIIDGIFHSNGSYRYGSSSYRSSSIYWRASQNTNASKQNTQSDVVQVRNKYEKFDNILLEDDERLPARAKAESILYDLKMKIQKYGYATANDLYALLNEPNNTFNDCNWGWTDLSQARIVNAGMHRVSLRLPRVVPLK